MVECGVVQLGNLAADVLNIGRLVTLTSVGYGGEVGAVGLQEE